MPEEEKKRYRPGIDSISTKKDARAYLKELLKVNDLNKYESRVMRTFNFLAGPEGGYNVVMAVRIALTHHDLTPLLLVHPGKDIQAAENKETPQ